MQMAVKRCSWLLFQMQIALINVLSTNMIALYFEVQFDCLLSDENIISTNKCLRGYCLFWNNVECRLNCQYRSAISIARFFSRLNESYANEQQKMYY